MVEKKNVGAGGRGERAADLDAAYDTLTAGLRPGDIVLLKSSNAVGLRHLGDWLVDGRVDGAAS